MEQYEINRKRFMITADDFGISLRANRNILFLVSIGKIDRVSVMSKGKFTDQEIEQLLKSQVKIDIHLDILHEYDMNRKKREGTIGRILEFLGKILKGALSSKKVAAEWKEQIELFQKILGKIPDGINSHEHIHFFPPFFNIVLQLEDAYHIPFVRFGESLTLPHNNLKAYVLHILRIFNRKACSRSNCVSSNQMVSLDWIKNVASFIENPPRGTTEIACHPEKAEDFNLVKEYF